MIIMPPDEIKRYITVDENGEWVHDPNMPIELEEKFVEFVENVKKAKSNRIEQ